MIRFFITLLVVLPNFAFANQKDGQLEIKKIDDNVFLHTSYSYIENVGLYPSNGLVVIDNNDAYIIDTPWPKKDTKTLLTWIKKSGYTPKASLSTHFHDDRTSGIDYLNQHSIKTYSSALTNQLIKGEKAALTFDGENFSMLKGKIEAYYPGAGHSQDNIVVWLPKSKMLFGGCLIRSLSAKGMGNTADGSLGHWDASIKNVINKFPNIETVIPGHGSLGGTQLLTHTIQLVEKATARKSALPETKTSKKE